MFQIFTRIRKKRFIEKFIEKEIGKEEATILAETKTNNNVHILVNLIEIRMENGEEFILVFINLRAAFDTIEKAIIWKCS